MILGMHHSAIATHDLDRLAAFYCDVLGMKKVEELEWAENADNDAVTGLDKSAARLVLLVSENFALEIFEYRNPIGRRGDPDRPVCDAGITHLCFVVTDIDREYARMKEAGMRFHCAPTSAASGNPIRATYGRDPDGNVVELIEIVGDTPFDYKSRAVRWRRGRSRLNPHPVDQRRT